jgi:hypothetical protein
VSIICQGNVGEILAKDLGRFFKGFLAKRETDPARPKLYYFLKRHFLGAEKLERGFFQKALPA